MAGNQAHRARKRDALDDNAHKVSGPEHFHEIVKEPDGRHVKNRAADRQPRDQARHATDEAKDRSGKHGPDNAGESQPCGIGHEGGLIGRETFHDIAIDRSSRPIGFRPEQPKLADRVHAHQAAHDEPCELIADIAEEPHADDRADGIEKDRTMKRLQGQERALTDVNHDDQRRAPDDQPDHLKKSGRVEIHLAGAGRTCPGGQHADRQRAETAAPADRLEYEKTHQSQRIERIRPAGGQPSVHHLPAPLRSRKVFISPVVVRVRASGSRSGILAA
ncbi:hypothetical protein FGO68_gene14605 [Halteria grandinella]|uniref:Uncharacterized protein n=1 Tax=Halteria grandinella TaxID=5974 RepID=A0A8J8NHY5_HALGN|nr:hypothetical protein FGO68_gene14605 [Halteria grandinella]